jgi:methylenetetrahydrofolate reductase (NADPH)
MAITTSLQFSRISDRLGAGGTSLSFEFSPPKDADGMQRLLGTARELARFEPSFVSVTYGAGGSTRRATGDVAERLIKDEGLCAMAHLTCVGATRDELLHVASDLADRGVQNVLALRGDAPRGQADPGPVEGTLRSASDLIRLLGAHFDFCLGAACYPEKHPRALSFSADLRELAQKVAAGATFLVTQLFFDPLDYLSFVERARASGIAVPILPGILPATDLDALLRMASRCGASVPPAIVGLLGRYAHDQAAMARVGVELTRIQCQALLEAGAPGLHFYTRNRAAEVAAVIEGLGLVGEKSGPRAEAARESLLNAGPGYPPNI